MRRKTMLLSVMLGLALLTGCSKSEKRESAIIQKVKTFSLPNHSMENVWKNGISLQQRGMFRFYINQKLPTPVKAGDKIRFAATGEATVLKVTRKDGEGSKGKLARFYVTVDRPLDPIGDGAPHTFDLIENK